MVLPSTWDLSANLIYIALTNFQPYFKSPCYIVQIINSLLWHQAVWKPLLQFDVTNRMIGGCSSYHNCGEHLLMSTNFDYKLPPVIIHVLLRGSILLLTPCRCKGPMVNAWHVIIKKNIYGCTMHMVGGTRDAFSALSAPPTFVK